MYPADLKNILTKLALPGPISLDGMPGDAGLRRYTRASSGQHSFVITQFPHADEMGRFIRTSAILSDFGIPTAHILHRDLEHLAIVQTDLGTLNFGQQLARHQHSEQSAIAHYQQCLDHLAILQFTRMDQFAHWTKFSTRTISMEMGMSWLWFMHHHCGIERESHTHQHWLKLSNYLIDQMIDLPYALTHRDFHSRNFMHYQNQMYWIDYQDMFRAPITYDAVSLTYDCYHIWSPELQKDWLTYYWHKIPAAQKMDLDAWLHACRVTSIQRHFKALGIFARLLHLYQRNSHLRWIMPTLYQLRRNLSYDDPIINTHLAPILADIEKRCIH